MSISRQRQNTINDRNSKLAAMSLVPGVTYNDMARKFGLSKTYISRILNKPEIKDMLDAGTSEIISYIPLACKVFYDRLTDPSEKTLQLKAAEAVLKAGAVLPSNVVNQTVNAVYNIQNNITLNPAVAAALDNQISMDDDECEVIDV